MSNQDITTRVAKAIYEGRNGPGCKPWAHLTKEHQKPYLADAQAALGVIGETRIEAFEEAARRAEEFPYEPRKSIAAGIRRLKAPSQTDRAEESE